jgi:hypothetical protein
MLTSIQIPLSTNTLILFSVSLHTLYTHQRTESIVRSTSTSHVVIQTDSTLTVIDVQFDTNDKQRDISTD